ncbi:E3 ubiquitin-protein ligase RHA1B-like [Panicum hallii]|jgi:RING-H2 zinc finger protein RHA1|uniref:E3 ubiquitin-protein ligase RHA1B-like n=1 Tax=Panicum hallii TaxID=206008 RepID=UPI000DF4E6EA|nr:E3 ubiquitin-protein ligase RHA1B-like [Panicum hallii]
MGFPVGYSELVLPKQLLHLLLLLGYIRRFLLSAFHAVGLGDLLDLGDDHQALLQDHHHGVGAGGAQQGRDHGAQAEVLVLQHRRPEFRAVPAMVIEEVLPVVRFDELAACVGGDCAVCLSGIGGGDEVRRLSNCRHAFHRGCLDRWMEHDQRTCPLCRAPLIPDEMAGALWAAAAGVPDASDFDFFYFGAPLTPVSSPTLLRPHELLLSGLGGYQ